MNIKKSLVTKNSKKTIDPNEAFIILKTALEDLQETHDLHGFLLALFNMAKAKGGLELLSRNTGLGREYLYHILSKKGNPSLATAIKICTALGVRLSVRHEFNDCNNYTRRACG